MIKNSTLVQIFLNQFYRQRVDKLGQFVSPNFSYSSPAVSSIGFCGFIDHCNLMFESVTVYVNEIKSHNDQHFFIDYSINITHKAFKGGGISIPGCAKFLMVDDLIENITVFYDPRLIKTKTKPQKATYYL